MKILEKKIIGKKRIMLISDNSKKRFNIAELPYKKKIDLSKAKYAFGVMISEIYENEVKKLYNSINTINEIDDDTIMGLI